MTIDETTVTQLRTKLLEEKERLKSELSRFATKTDKEGDYKTRFPDDLGDRNDENATEVEQYADNLALEQSLEKQLKDVIDALEKIDNGTYGKDEETGEDIDIERLKAYPAARTNIREK